VGEETRSDSAVENAQEPNVRKPYHHGNVPAALQAAARQSLEAGDPEHLGLRDLARKIGVSPTAAYRHFTNKDDLMASVAAEGFDELRAALRDAENQPDPGVGVGLAYVEFALSRPGLFRLMFGPLLSERDKYATLRDSAAEALAVMERLGHADGAPAARQRASAMVAYSAIHGLVNFFIMKILPESEARALAHGVLEYVKSARNSRKLVALARTLASCAAHANENPSAENRQRGPAERVA
jgi:AcrR family transcriptional regulator